MVHFSGVFNKFKNIDLQDDHRSIVDEFDIIDNISQIKKLIKENYNGYLCKPKDSWDLSKKMMNLQLI